MHDLFSLVPLEMPHTVAAPFLVVCKKMWHKLRAHKYGTLLSSTVLLKSMISIALLIKYVHIFENFIYLFYQKIELCL